MAKKNDNKPIHPSLAQNLYQVIQEELATPTPDYAQIFGKTLGFPLEVIASVLKKLAQEHPKSLIVLFRETIDIPNRSLWPAVTQALGHLCLPESFILLDRLEEQLTAGEATTKEAKKITKEVARARHRLRSFGVVPPTQEKNPSPAVKITAERKFEQALISNVDGAGNILGLYVMRSPGAKYETAVLWFNNYNGLKDCRIYNFNQRQLEGFVQEWDLALTGVQLVPTERAYLHYLVAHYLAQNESSDWPLPRDFVLWRRYLEVPTPYEKNPIYTKITEASIQEALALLLPASEGLAQTPEMKNWLLEPGIVAEYAKQWRDRQQSRILVADAFQMEFKQKLVAEMLERIFSPDTILYYRQRLEHMAWYFYITKQIGAARLALAAACGLKNMPLPTNSPLLRVLGLLSLEAIANALEKEND